ncbi:DNA repair and recombination protein RadA [Candidatus Woesearchaeota archaeon]|nr:DNA repair and recombination protein RadA [Candidatus Woesearchaeota archaeon]
MKNERESMERESMNVREVRSLRRDREPGIANLPGVGAATVEKLEASGYGTLLSIAVASPGEIVDAVGMGEASARKVIQAARGMLDMGFESGDELLKRREKIMRISVGSENFNLLMNGGLETGAITECFGAYGSSKTQVAHQLAVNVQKLKDEDGNPLSAIYIDTENTFRPERICQFAKGAGFDPHEALKRIKVARAFNSDHQMLLVEKIEDLIQKEGIQVGLVIVDSLTAHFRAEFIGRGTLAERQQKLNRHMHALSRLASTYNLCVYVTNQVMAKPDQFFGDPTEAIGGHIVAHNSTFRIYLRKGKKGTRVAKLVDSPNLPDGEAIFEITTDGLRDV